MRHSGYEDADDSVLFRHACVPWLCAYGGAWGPARACHPANVGLPRRGWPVDMGKKSSWEVFHVAKLVGMASELSAGWTSTCERILGRDRGMEGVVGVMAVRVATYIQSIGDARIGSHRVIHAFIRRNEMTRRRDLGDQACFPTGSFLLVSSHITHPNASKPSS